MTSTRLPAQNRSGPSVLSTRWGALVAATGLFFIGIMLGAINRSSHTEAVAAPNDAQTEGQEESSAETEIGAAPDSDTSVVDDVVARECGEMSNVAIGDVQGTARSGGSVSAYGDRDALVPVIVELLADPSPDRTATTADSPWADTPSLLIRPEGVLAEVWAWQPDPLALGNDEEPVGHSQFLSALVTAFGTEVNCADATAVVLDGDASGADLALRHACDQEMAVGLLVLRSPTLRQDSDLTCLHSVDVVILTPGPPDEAALVALNQLALRVGGCSGVRPSADVASMEAIGCATRFGHVGQPVPQGFEAELLEVWLEDCKPSEGADSFKARWCASTS